VSSLQHGKEEIMTAMGDACPVSDGHEKLVKKEEDGGTLPFDAFPSRFRVNN